jgi:nitroimidazol reductase NimA-like FMN-containing flavoprotein (pyridoxamine 5'-phosphate oxidase superfamily)
MPVWGVWHERSLWFSSGNGSRKARNLASNPRCAVSTDNPAEPVVVEGTAERVADLDAIAAFARLIDVKYSTSYGPDFYDPAVNSTFRVQPLSVFGLTQDDFAGSPTRWLFGDE